jgi:callose synthase
MVFQSGFRVSWIRQIQVMKVSSNLVLTFFLVDRNIGYRDQRFFSGVLSALVSAFITFVYLEPLFVPIGLDLAMVALWVLSIGAGLVGMSLGVLLPTVFPGICFGISLSLLVGTFLSFYHALYLPVVGGVLSLIGMLLSTRYVWI